MRHKGVRSHHVESDILKEGPGTETSWEVSFATDCPGGGCCQGVTTYPRYASPHCESLVLNDSWFESLASYLSGFVCVCLHRYVCT